MSHVVKKFLIIGLGLICIVSHSIFAASDYFVPNRLVNLYLQIHSPITKDFSPFFKIQLDDPVIATQMDSQRLILSSPIRILLSNQGQIRGNISLSSSYQYDAVKKQLAFKQPKIESLEISNLSASTEKILAEINPLIAKLLSGIVIYEFNAEEPMINKAPSRIHIEDIGIRLFFD